MVDILIGHFIERSKRVSLKDKYIKQKHIREYHRKLRKEAKKAKKNGLAIKRPSKVTRIPNLYPNKKVEIENHDLLRELERMAKKKNAVITQEDINNLVKESKGKVICDNKGK